MLTQMRQVTRGFFAMAIIGLLALAFAIWGIHDVFRPIQSNEVAHGRGIAITDVEFARAFDNEFKAAQAQAQAQSGRKPTKQEAFAADFHMQVLDRMITQRVFDRLAEKAGVDTSDEAVAAEVRSNPAFQNPVTGAFDPNTYKTMLQRNGLTRSAYEADLRRNMTRVQLAHALATGVRPPSSFGRMILAFESERRTVAIAAVSPDRVPQPPAPTEAELAEFYKAQSRAFALPEMRTFTIVRADQSAFEARVDVPEAKIKELFDFRKDKLTTPEKRSFVLLSGPDQAKAQEASRRLASGEDPQAVARALGMQAIPFNDKTKGDIPDRKVADAVFALAAGATTQPVEGVAWTVARVSAITPGVTPTFEEARALLRNELARDEAQSMMEDAVEKFEDARSGGAPLEAAAQQAGLTVEKAGPVDARGLDEKGSPSPAVLDQPDLLKAAFAAVEGEPSDWISSEDGGSVLVRVDAVKPTGAPPLAQIRDQVATAWRYRKIGEAMQQIVKDVEAAVEGGQPFADAVRARRLQVMAQPQEIDRAGAQQGPMAPLAPAIFAAREGDVVSAVGGPRNQFMLIAHVMKVTRANPESDPQRVAALRQIVTEALSNDILASAQTGARQAAKIRLNQELIDRSVGKTDATDAGS